MRYPDYPDGYDHQYCGNIYFVSVGHIHEAIILSLENDLNMGTEMDNSSPVQYETELRSIAKGHKFSQ